MRLTSYDTPNTRVVDSDGNPVVVSAICTYRIVQPKLAALAVDNCQTYVRKKAEVALKYVVSQFPYDAPDLDKDGRPDVPSLKHDGGPDGVVQQALVNALQRGVTAVGVKVESFQLNEISYAPEIGALMLKKQQAQD